MLQNDDSADIWFFVGHSIGVTLLGIHTIETARRALGARAGRGYIVVNGDGAQPYADMLRAYPHITLVHLSVRGLPQLLGCLWRSLWRTQIAFHPLIFGRIHTVHRMLSWLLVAGRGGSTFVEFSDVTQVSVRAFGRHVCVPKRLDQGIFTSLEDAVAATGLRVERQQPALQFESAASTGGPAGSYIVVHPFAANDMRSLPMDRWRTLISCLREKYPHLDIIITGSTKDKDRAHSLCVDTQTHFGGDVVGAGFLNMMALIANARLYLGVDTGPTHVAAHLHAPTIVIGNRSNPCWLPTYNPTVKILTETAHCTCDSAKGGDCIVILNGQRYYRCMIEVTDEAIKQAVSDYLHE
jgi:hypothetical protein